MKKIPIIALAAALIAAAPAWAADPPATNAPAAKPGRGKADSPKPDPSEKLICTREEQTDSFIPKRVCRTQAQIDELRRSAQQLNDDQQLLNGRPQGGPGR